MIKARLKYIVKAVKGKVPKAFSDDNSLPPYLSMELLRGSQENIQHVISDENLKLIDENEVLILWDGANAGEIMFSKKGYLSSTMAVLEANPKYFQKRFLYYFLKSKENELKRRPREWSDSRSRSGQIGNLGRFANSARLILAGHEYRSNGTWTQSPHFFSAQISRWVCSAIATA